VYFRTVHPITVDNFVNNFNPGTIKTEFYAHGKLLITGEYAVLDGADALAIPTRYGQRMVIKKSRGSDLIWDSLEENGESWFSSQISLFDFSALKTTDQVTSDQLEIILKNAVRLNPEFLDKWNGFKVETQVEFPRNWGLGTSSTLIALVAQWADVNPLELYFKTFNGSGYDVACARCDTPIVYYNDEDEIGYTPVEFFPSFSDSIYFVHLGEKQDTAQGIKDYLKNAKSRKKLAEEITKITEATLQAKTISSFAEQIEKHEAVIAKAMDYETVKKSRFPDFWGCVKSLGAWGGDFSMVISDKNQDDTEAYFINKGYKTIIPFREMIFKGS